MKLASFRSHSPIFSIPRFQVKLIRCRSEHYSRAGSLSYWKSLLNNSQQQTTESAIPYHMHPECAMLEYHHNSMYGLNNSRTVDTPTAQIGTSSEPCHACKMFFATYKDKPPDYSLQLNLSSTSSSSSPERHSLWLPPRLEGIGDDVEERFASLLLDDYRAHQVQTQDIPSPKQRETRYAALLS